VIKVSSKVERLKPRDKSSPSYNQWRPNPYWDKAKHCNTGRTSTVIHFKPGNDYEPIKRFTSAFSLQFVSLATA